MRIPFSLVGAAGLSLLITGCFSRPQATEADVTSADALPPTTAASAPVAAPPATSAADPPPVQPEKVKEPEAPQEEEQPPDRIEVDLETLVAGLQSSYATQVFTAGEFFRQIPPGQRREVLLELSKHADPNVRGTAWRVFSTVATKDDLATLQEAMQSPYSDVQVAALETMARFPNEQTVGILTRLLENAEYRQLAAGLLSRIGPACEAGVIPYATHADPVIRRAAWDVLAEAGTRKSVQALEQLSTQDQFSKDAALKRALERLRDRLRKA